MSVEDGLYYELVKATILRTYLLVHEAYQQWFGHISKGERQTYMEFAREKEHLFARWCAAENVNGIEQLRDLMILEEFKNCLPAAVMTYINEQKSADISEATILANEFTLTHNVSFKENGGNSVVTSSASNKPQEHFSK